GPGLPRPGARPTRPPSLSRCRIRRSPWTALFMRSARGYVTVGMAHRGYDLQLTRDDEKGWRATFYARGMEHSPTSATGSAWERTPWRAVQGGAREALTRTVDDQAAPRAEGDKSEGRQPQLPGARDMAAAGTTTNVHRRTALGLHRRLS